MPLGGVRTAKTVAMMLLKGVPFVPPGLPPLQLTGNVPGAHPGRPSRKSGKSSNKSQPLEIPGNTHGHWMCSNSPPKRMEWFPCDQETLSAHWNLLLKFKLGAVAPP